MGSSREQRKSKLEEELVKLFNFKDKKALIRRVERAYQQRVIDPNEVADKINNYIPLKGMTYKRDTQLTIESAETPSLRYSLTIKNDDALAYALRGRIIRNDPSYVKQVQMHISKEESTRHHKEGIRKKY